MSDYGTGRGNAGRIDRDTAERLLDGRPAAGSSGPLAARLRAARAPALPDELVGERAALLAFQAAQLHPIPRQRRLSMLKTTIAKLLTAKAAAVVAAAGAGGIALAAGTGVLPVELPNAASDHSVVATSAPAPHGDSPAAEPAKPAQAGGNPAPSMVGLCRAYNAELSNNPGKAMESPAFTALVDAAGAGDKVEGFCKEKLAAAAEHPGGAPEDATHDPAGAAEQGVEKAESHAQVPTSRPQPPAGPPAGTPTGGPTT
jgi:hypothetical protein